MTGDKDINNLVQSAVDAEQRRQAANTDWQTLIDQVYAGDPAGLYTALCAIAWREDLYPPAVTRFLALAARLAHSRGRPSKAAQADRTAVVAWKRYRARLTYQSLLAVYQQAARERLRDWYEDTDSDGRPEYITRRKTGGRGAAVVPALWRPQYQAMAATARAMGLADAESVRDLIFPNRRRRK